MQDVCASTAPRPAWPLTPALQAAAAGRESEHVVGHSEASGWIVPELVSVCSERCLACMWCAYAALWFLNWMWSRC